MVKIKDNQVPQVEVRDTKPEDKAQQFTTIHLVAMFGVQYSSSPIPKDKADDMIKDLNILNQMEFFAMPIAQLGGTVMHFSRHSIANWRLEIV